MGKKQFCFFQTAETGNRTPDSGVKGSGANHYPRAPALKWVKIRLNNLAVEGLITVIYNVNLAYESTSLLFYDLIYYIVESGEVDLLMHLKLSFTPNKFYAMPNYIILHSEI